MTKLTVAFRNIANAPKNGALKSGLQRNGQATEAINIGGKLNSDDGNLILVRPRCKHTLQVLQCLPVCSHNSRMVELIFITF